MKKYHEERWESEGLLIAVISHQGYLEKETSGDIEAVEIDGSYFFPHPFDYSPIKCKKGQVMRHYFINT